MTDNNKCVRGTLQEENILRLSGDSHMKNTVGISKASRAMVSLLISNAYNRSRVEKIKPAHKIRNQCKILLVEDNLVAQAANKDALEQTGYKVETTATGEQALNLLAHGNYSLIFMDVDLPDISGIEVAARVRGSNNHTPIIALTTHISEEIKKRCLAVGMNAFANKPISSVNLSKLVRQYCAKVDDLN